MQVELLWWRGCPSTAQAEALVRAEIERFGLDPGVLSVREIRDQAEAESERFAGSPTIRVDGSDVVDPGDTPAGLNCRIYHLEDGRISAVPDAADVAAALAAAGPGSAVRSG